MPPSSGTGSDSGGPSCGSRARMASSITCASLPEMRPWRQRPLARQAPSPAVAAVFDPVQTATTLEETVERLGTAIRLGLLGPGARLPPERELADQLGSARPTLRQALTSLTESGHLIAPRGRGGGTFVSQAPPLAESSRPDLQGGHWRELLDYRIAVEVGTVVLASE